jgi:hypothetical protein
VGQEHICANCQALLRIEATGAVCVQEQIQAQLPTPAATPSGSLPGEEIAGDLRAADHGPPELLDQIENVLWRMLSGVFRFTFVVLPRSIGWGLGRIWPTLVKLGRILGLLLCWLAVVCLPTILCVVYEPGMLWLVASLVWGAVALVGSVWGVQWVFRAWWVKGSFERAMRKLFNGNMADQGATADRPHDDGPRSSEATPA